MKLLQWVNTLLLSLELLITLFILFFSIGVTAMSKDLIFVATAIAVLSLVSLVYMLVQIIFKRINKIEKRFVYLTHAGFILTLASLTYEGYHHEMQQHRSEVPFGVLSFGMFVIIPYLHANLIFYWKTMRSSTKQD